MPATETAPAGNPQLHGASGNGLQDSPSATATSLSPSLSDDEEEEEDVCRICRDPGVAENPLRYPCACRGSIKFVHQDCLLQWLNHSSNAPQCEVCKHAFSFSPVYAKNAPTRLPFQEFIVGMAMKTCRVMQFYLRLSFVLSMWLLIIPFITFWTWQLAFLRSFGEAQRLFLSHLSTTVILTDCLHGFLLYISITAIITLGYYYTGLYFRHFHELGGQARVARNEGEAGGAQGIVQIIRRAAENVAAWWEMQAARLEAFVQLGDGRVPLAELVGMQGPVFGLVQTAFDLQRSYVLSLGVVIFVPFSLGRIILHYILWLFSSGSAPVLAISTITPLAESAISLANITLQNAFATVTMLPLETQGSGLLKGNASENNVSTPLSAEILKGVAIGTSRLSDVTTLAIGYMFIYSLVFINLGAVASIRYTKGEPLTMGRFYGVASVAETIPSLLRQFVAAMRHLMIMIKVAFFLVIQIMVFPLICGWWLDLCTIRMLGKSMAQRVQFFSVSPLASSLVHWVAGIVYMIQITIFVKFLRGVLRKGVLFFIRDPADPNYKPFRNLIDDPVHKCAFRVLLYVAVYGSLMVMLVFLPAKLAIRIAPSIFPLDISVSDPFTEIPADMLLFQTCYPFAINI